MSLEDDTIYILREAYAEFHNPAILWSMGKDSTTLLYMTRKAFLGNIPFPVIHIDTGHKFPQMYQFRDWLADEWELDLVISMSDAVTANIGPEVGKLICCNLLKTKALKDTLEQYKFDALILAIRRDEHGIRAKERVFSPREQDFSWDYQHQPLEMWNQYQSVLDVGNHMRIHPILQWREIDVWKYIREHGIPVNPLYFSNGTHRYRSLGCMPCTNPIESTAGTIDEIVEELVDTKVAERSGRAQDKEDSFTMQKLRALGYM